MNAQNATTTNEHFPINNVSTLRSHFRRRWALDKISIRGFLLDFCGASYYEGVYFMEWHYHNLIAVYHLIPLLLVFFMSHSIWSSGLENWMSVQARQGYSGITAQKRQLFLEASIARLLARWPAELEVAGSIHDRGRQQCWRGKHCWCAPSSARDVKSFAPVVESLAHVKEPVRWAKLYAVLPCDVTYGRSGLVKLTGENCQRKAIKHAIFLHRLSYSSTK